jgi:DNA polymerase
VPGYGRLDAPLLVVGEQPGQNEAQEGMGFVGKSGKELTAGLGSLGRDGAFVTNVRKCMGVGIESDETHELSIRHCTSVYLQPELDALTTVRTVLCIGADALETVVGVKSAIQWHGAVLSAEEANAIRRRTHAGDGVSEVSSQVGWDLGAEE